MFTSQSIRDRFQERPFTPVRVRTSSGESFDVHHPDLVIVGRGFLIIGTASKRDPALADAVARVSILHITSLEDLPPPPKQSSNGRKRKH